MKTAEVQIGETYRVKVSGNVADVRITGENPHGGWDGVNVATNRKVRIQSAQRLRGKTPRRPAKGKPTAPSAPGAKRASKATGKAKAAAKRHTGQRDAKGAKRPSGLDAAARVLAEAGEPMNAKAIAETALAKGYWTTKGATPWATFYSAMIREIAAKGTRSRFRKISRGMFEFAK